MSYFKAVYFFDASAIVKLLVAEPGSDKVKRLLDECGIAHTSWVLIAEALGCLKRKRREGHLTDEQYASSVYSLFAHLREGNLDPMDLTVENGRPRLRTHERELFDRFRRFPHLDVGDLLQLAIIKDSYLAAFAGESQARLVTADGDLGKAAEAEGIPVAYVNIDG
jgi:predicted nucleic acid-binding protein